MAEATKHPLDRPVITDRRRCPKCDYELVGLRAGDLCPECGTPVRGGKITFAETTMGSAPVGYLRSLSAGANLFAYGFIAMIAAAAAGAARGIWNTWGVGVTPGDPPWPEMSIAAASSVCVALGVVPVLKPRRLEAVGDEKLGSEYLYRRRSARWLAIAWMLAAFGGLALAVSPMLAAPADRLLWRIGQLGVWVGAPLALIGLVPLASWIRHLCEWAGDTTLAERFKILILWLLIAALPTTLALLMTPTIGWGPLRTSFGLLAWIVAGLSWLWVFLFFHWFATLCRWAVDNRIEMLAVDARRTERIAKRIEANRARQEKEERDLATAADRSRRSIEAQAAMHPPQIPLAHDAPYELAPDEPDDDASGSGPAGDGRRSS